MYVLEEIMDCFLLKTHWSYLNYNDLLLRLNAYKSPRKEHHVVEFWVTDKVAALEILFWKYLEYVPLI